MRAKKISGLVKEIENFSPRLSVVTLITFKGKCREERIPVYMQVEKEYTGKWVDIVSYRYGFLWRDFKQTVEGLFKKDVSNEIPYVWTGMMNTVYLSNRDYSSVKKI